jgi:hypothetical protein
MCLSRTTMALAAFAALASAPAAAQQPPDLWRAQLELGFNGSTGNSSFSVLRTGGSVTRLSTEVFELELSALVRYGESEDRVIANDQRVTGKFDWHPEADFSPFTFVTASRDRIRKIDFKVNGGAGGKWTFLRRGGTKVSWSLAALFEHENLHLDPGATVAEQSSVVRWSGRLKVDHQVASGATFQHITFWQPEVTDFGDYLVEMSNSLSSRLTGSLSLVIEHEYLHDQLPPPGVQADDQRLSVVLRVVL